MIDPLAHPRRGPCWAAVLLLAAGAGAISAQEVLVAPGTVTEGIVSPSDSTQRYALYIPAGYDGSEAAPVLFVLDPRGRALIALNVFRAAAEARGWIVLSSYNTVSDGPVEPNVRALNALLADARASFEIAPGRLYIAGFSGTARLAWEFAAQLDGEVAGIFGASAGLVPARRSAPARVAFFGTAGVVDFNHDELRRFEAQLGAWGLPHRVRIFEGEHAWPPPELADEAVAWFDLQAMRSGLAPADSAFVAMTYARDSARLAALEARHDMAALYAGARGMAADYAGLRDTTLLAERVRALSTDGRVADALERAAALLEVSAARERRLVEYLAALDPRRPVPAVADVRAALRIGELQEAAAGSEPAGGRAARRALEQIFVATSFYAPRDLIERGAPGHALMLLDVAGTIHDGHPQVWLQRARGLAAQGRLDEAASALERALGAGVRLETARADSLLARVLGSRR